MVIYIYLILYNFNFKIIFDYLILVKVGGELKINKMLILI